ncbi:hypothetical protein F2Q68_00045249 [Brassica cretica]|uniref:Uncharacterized protein n=1 Tax=Brassica cretica TaxID=69181 RepID=A0A8S9LL98_BRACR|nr:hypothetical protein F2Q68_00045249 [Brassica cretica]
MWATANMFLIQFLSSRLGDVTLRVSGAFGYAGGDYFDLSDNHEVIVLLILLGVFMCRE